MANRKKDLPLNIAEYELRLPAISASSLITKRLLLESMAHHAPMVLLNLVESLLDVHGQAADLVLESDGSKPSHIPKDWYESLFNWFHLHSVVLCGESDIESKELNRRVPHWQIDYLREVLGCFKQLHDGLQDWARRWHLNEIDAYGIDSHFGLSVFKGAALFALFSHSILGEDIDKGWLNAVTVYDGLPAEYPHIPPKPFVFRFSPGWSPTSQKRADVAKEIRNTFEKQLVQYLDEQQTLAQTHPFLESAPRTINEDHIEWLVYYQFHSWSYQRIANDLAYRDRKSVEQAVKAVADRACLILRPPGRGGRPKSVPSLKS